MRTATIYPKYFYRCTKCGCENLYRTNKGRKKKAENVVICRLCKQETKVTNILQRHCNALEAQMKVLEDKLKGQK